MFDIEYKGANTVIISTKKSKLVLDPKLSVVGLKDVSTAGDIEVATEARFATNNDDARILIEGPGEYEVGDFSIRGVPATRHLDTDAEPKASTIYRIEVGDVRIVVLGNVIGKLTEEQLERIGVIDMIILPVGGGGYTLDATSAASLVRATEPRVVIPVHYADDAVAYEVPQDTLGTFTTELGAPVEQVGAKYKIKSLSALPEVMTVAEISRS